MTSDDLPRFLYLLLLLLAVGGFFLVESRRNLGRSLQTAAIWALIFLGAIGGYGLWDDIRRDTGTAASVVTGGRIDLPQAPDGHFYLSAEVDGQRIRFMVDTGASDIVLTQADARRLGLDPESLAYSGRAQTANGTVVTAPVTLGTVALGPHEDRAVPAVVNSGEMDMSLMGMSFLSRFRLTLDGETMTLER